MNITSATAVLGLAFFVTGCSTMKVTSDRDHSYNFKNIQTYQWIDGPAKVLNEDDTYINEDIRMALNNELTKRGMRQVLNTAEADVQVAYYVKLKEEQEYTAPVNRDERKFSGGMVYSRKSNNWRYEKREPDLNVYAVETGTLTVLFYNVETGKRVWRGNLKTKFDRSQPEERQQKHLRVAAEQLIHCFR